MQNAERLLDCLADSLLDLDELLALVESEEGSAVRWMRGDLQQMYDRVDAVMRLLCD